LADEPTGNLDQRTGEEVLGLHAQGVTLLLVTHDERVAHHAQRLLRLARGAAGPDRGAAP